MLGTGFFKNLESPCQVTLDILIDNREEDTENFWADGFPKMELIK